MKQSHPFAAKVAASPIMPKREIELSVKHHYWIKEQRQYRVAKQVQRGDKVVRLHYGTTVDEHEAQQMSLEMCRIINAEIRRRDAMQGGTA